MLFLSITLLLSSCGANLCKNSLRYEKISPDGKITASLFERNCGATTPYVQVVSLRLSTDTLELEKFDDWVFSIHGKSNIKIKWEEIDKLSISYSGTGDSPTLKNQWKEIKISYTKKN
jgi:hypothetical protein